MTDIERRHYARGTSLVQECPWGWYHGGRAMCSDGRVRALKRIAPTADTFFSVPAAVTVGGRTVSGYVTVECESGSSVETDDDPAVVKFVAVTYGRNGALLPDGAWRRAEATCYGCGAAVPDEPGRYYCDPCVARQLAAQGDETAAYDDYHAFADECARRSR